MNSYINTEKDSPREKRYAQILQHYRDINFIRKGRKGGEYH